jgi:hypothetical protein
LNGVVPQAAPIVEGYVSAANEAVARSQVFGVDPFAEVGFRSFLGSEATSQGDVLPLISEPQRCRF